MFYDLTSFPDRTDHLIIKIKFIFFFLFVKEKKFKMVISDNVEYEHFKLVPAIQSWIKTQPHLPQNIRKYHLIFFYSAMHIETAN